MSPQVIASSPSCLAAPLASFVVHGEALHQVLTEAGHRPLSELRAAVASDAEADGEDRVEVVVAQGPLDLTAPLLANL
ncbi:MAG TPA: hypothetical protein VNO30_06540 [Kofleriaceae bacterium]|nr:hypothetical protein [Kofleriaceae bacterium]